MIEQEEKIRELERRITVLENQSSPKLPGIKVVWYILLGFGGLFLILMIIGIVQFVSAG